VAETTTKPSPAPLPKHWPCGFTIDSLCPRRTVIGGKIEGYIVSPRDASSITDVVVHNQRDAVCNQVNVNDLIATYRAGLIDTRTPRPHGQM